MAQVEFFYCSRETEQGKKNRKEYETKSAPGMPNIEKQIIFDLDLMRADVDNNQSPMECISNCPEHGGKNCPFLEERNKFYRQLKKGDYITPEQLADKSGPFNDFGNPDQIWLGRGRQN